MHLNEVEFYPEYKFWEGTLPVNILKELKDNCEVAKNTKDINYNLVGHINEEYYLDTNSKKLLEDLLLQSNIFENEKLYIVDLWVNYQKKYEYNPMHHHNGEYSFVLWLNIPFDINLELDYFKNVKENANTSGCFEFYYYDKNDNLIKRIQLANNKTFEGKIIVFNSKLQHSVSPFYTSDDYRISIAGNLDYI